MCAFCDDIYPEGDTRDIVFGRGKYKNLAQGGSFIARDCFIVVDHDGDLDIVVDPGDPYELGLVCDIEFCPYCGRKLKGDENKWFKNELIKLIDRTYEDFKNAPGGEGWCEIDGKEYHSDM